MSRPLTAAEAGRDLQRDTPTLAELEATHDWRQEERAEGRYIVDVCQQCDYERSAGRAGRPPACEVREIPSRFDGHNEREEEVEA